MVTLETNTSDEVAAFAFLKGAFPSVGHSGLILSFQLVSVLIIGPLTHLLVLY